MSDKSQAATAQASSAAGRAEALQNEADDLRRQIAAFSAQIADLGTRIINLIGMEGKETELAVLVTERTEVEAELAKLEAKLGGAATRGEGLQNGETIQIRQALEKLTIKMNKSMRDLEEKVNESVRDLEEKVNAFVRALTKKVEIMQFGLPQAMMPRLPKMLFTVLDQDAQNGTRTPVGVSFFVRPTLAITAYHVIEAHYPHIEIGDTVYLLREAGLSRIWEEDDGEEDDGEEDDGENGPNLIKTKLVKFDKKDDWALMELSEATDNIIPFEICSAETARWYKCQMLGYNINLSTYAEAEDVAIPQITRTPVDPRTLMPRMFLYTCAVAHLGDSDGAVVVSPAGKAVMMHCDPLNGTKGNDEAVAGGTSSKKHKGDVRAMLSRGGVYVGIRLDYMEKQGYFDGY